MNKKYLPYRWIQILFWLVLITTFSNAQWVYSIGGISSVSSRSISVVVDGSGNIYMAGYFGGTENFNPGGIASNLTSAGSFDIFFAKYTSSGVLTWVKQIGGTGNDKVYAMTIDNSGNVYLTGKFQLTVDFDPNGGTSNLVATTNGLFIAKYNTSGSFVWAKNFGGTGANNIPEAIALTSTTDICVVGEFYGTANFSTTGTTNLTSNGGGDVFVAEYNSSDGGLIWANNFGGPDTDYGYGVAVDGADYVTVVGKFSSTVDFDPSVATSNMTSAGGYDIYCSTYDFNGAFYGAMKIGSANDDEAKSIARTADDNFLIAGDYSGTADFNPGAGTANLTPAADNGIFFGKYDFNLGYMWAKGISGGSGTPTALSHANRITSDASNNVYITGNLFNNLNVDPNGGTTTLSGAGDVDCFFAKYNSSGTLVWGQSLGTGGYDDGLGLAVDGSGNTIISGYFSGSGDFDPGAGTVTLTATGANDIFFGKYNSSGVLPVELTSFTALSKGNNVELKWNTATETNNYGFEIERKTVNTWGKVSFVEGNGTTNTPKEYSFTIKNISAGKYLYRLKQIDRDGKFEYSNTVEATVANIKTFGIDQNYPNPFNPTTVISYQLPVNSYVTLKIFDPLGREVATLVNEKQDAGVRSVRFDGSALPSGVYFYRLQAGDFTQTRKLLLLK